MPQIRCWRLAVTHWNSGPLVARLSSKCRLRHHFRLAFAFGHEESNPGEAVHGAYRLGKLIDFISGRNGDLKCIGVARRCSIASSPATSATPPSSSLPTHRQPVAIACLTWSTWAAARVRMHAATRVGGDRGKQGRVLEKFRESGELFTLSLEGPRHLSW